MMRALPIQPIATNAMHQLLEASLRVTKIRNVLKHQFLVHFPSTDATFKFEIIATASNIQQVKIKALETHLQESTSSHLLHLLKVVQNLEMKIQSKKKTFNYVSDFDQNGLFHFLGKLYLLLSVRKQRRFLCKSIYFWYALNFLVNFKELLACQLEMLNQLSVVSQKMYFLGRVSHIAFGMEHHLIS